MSAPLLIYGFDDDEQEIVMVDPREKIVTDCLDMAARDSMFDELVEALEDVVPFIRGWPGSKSMAPKIDKLIARAKQFQRKEP